MLQVLLRLQMPQRFLLIGPGALLLIRLLRHRMLVMLGWNVMGIARIKRWRRRCQIPLWRISTMRHGIIAELHLMTVTALWSNQLRIPLLFWL
jgi:hypothetical protein